jgi:chromosomal replication initiation ATPase DnaA
MNPQNPVPDWAEPVISLVCRATGLPAGDFVTRARLRGIHRETRDLAAFLLYRNSGKSALAIGAVFGYRNHNAVMESCMRLRVMARNNVRLSNQVDRLLARLS